MAPFSLNVPLPGRVLGLIDDLQASLPSTTATPRAQPTLVIKRLGDADPDVLTTTLRRHLRGTGPFDLAVTGLDAFERPPTGRGPVVYLIVESRPLRTLHETLCAAFEPAPDIEGAAYVPHVTVARGGGEDVLELLGDHELEPVQWRASELLLWDARDEVPAAHLGLPL